MELSESTVLHGCQRDIGDGKGQIIGGFSLCATVEELPLEFAAAWLQAFCYSKID